MSAISHLDSLLSLFMQCQNDRNQKKRKLQTEYQQKLNSPVLNKEDVSTPKYIKIRNVKNYINQRIEIRGWLQRKPRKTNSGIIFVDIIDDPRYSALRCILTDEIMFNLQSTLIMRGKIVSYHKECELRVDYYKLCDPSYFMVNPLSLNLGIKKRCQYIISGYISYQTFHVVIPKDIKSILIRFLGDIWNDRWDIKSQSDPDIIDKCIEIENNKVTATPCICYYLYKKFVFGAKIIYGFPLCQKYKWKIQIIHIESCNFGVIPISINTQYEEYGYWYSKNGKMYGLELKELDIIEIRLDLEHMTLAYSVNGEYLGIAYNNLPATNYKLAVMMGYDGEEIKLLNAYNE